MVKMFVILLASMCNVRTSADWVWHSSYIRDCRVVDIIDNKIYCIFVTVKGGAATILRLAITTKIHSRFFVGFCVGRPAGCFFLFSSETHTCFVFLFKKSVFLKATRSCIISHYKYPPKLSVDWNYRDSRISCLLVPSGFETLPG